MKTLRHVSALLLASMLALSTTAMASPRVVSPQVAAESNAMVQGVLANLVSEGYTLDTVEEDAQEYLAKPKAPYVWGNLVYTYSRPQAGLTLREKVEVVVKVKYLASGIAIPELSVKNLLAD